jgi:hypothetical protein
MALTAVSKVMMSPSTAASDASRNVQLPTIKSVQFAALPAPSAAESTLIVAAALAEPANAARSALATPDAPIARARDRDLAAARLRACSFVELLI